MSEIAKIFTAAFETVKEHIRYFKSKPDADAAYNGRIIGLEDALSQFRPVMKMIEQAALSQPSVERITRLAQEFVESPNIHEAIADNGMTVADGFQEAFKQALDKYNVTVKG